MLQNYRKIDYIINRFLYLQFLTDCNLYASHRAIIYGSILLLYIFFRKEETARYSTAIIKLVRISNNSLAYLCGYFIWKLDESAIFTFILDTLGLASKKCNDEER